MSVVKQRIKHLQLPECDYAALNEQQLANVRSAMGLMVNSASATAEVFSIAQMSSSDITAKLNSLEVCEDTVWAYWPAFREGFEIKWKVFASRLEDLWYPSSDDVIVIPPSAEWMLEVSHEETVRFVRRQTRRN